MWFVNTEIALQVNAILRAVPDVETLTVVFRPLPQTTRSSRNARTSLQITLASVVSRLTSSPSAMSTDSHPCTAAHTATVTVLECHAAVRGERFGCLSNPESVPVTSPRAMIVLTSEIKYCLLLFLESLLVCKSA